MKKNYSVYVSNQYTTKKLFSEITSVKQGLHIARQAYGKGWTATVQDAETGEIKAQVKLREPRKFD